MNSFTLRALAAAAMVTLLLAVTGCSHTFYLPESDTAAYQANLRAASSANNLMSSLQGKTFRLQFDSSGSRPRLSSSNVGQILREVPNLFVLDTVFHQISLDRISTQLEQQTDAWIGDRLSVLQQAGGHGVTLQRLNSVSAEVLAAPSFVYNAGNQSIAFDGRVKVTISGKILVDVVSGPGGFLLGLFGQNPNGEYDITMTVDDYRLQGQLQLSNPYTDAGSIRLLVSPQPGHIQVEGNAPSQISDGITQLMTRQLASPVDATGVLTYDNFGLADLRIVPAQGAPQLTARYVPAPHFTEPVSNLVARQSDGKLYHSQKRAGKWGPAAAIALPDTANSDPAIVPSDGGQLELAAVSSHGKLLYAGWREGAWRNVFQAPPPLRNNAPQTFSNTTPALVASGPSQVDIVLRGNDGSLYHARRVNGGWKSTEWIQAAESVAQRPFRDPVAVLGGSLMAVFFVDSQNRLFSVVYDLSSETWGTATQVTSQTVLYAPAAAGCGDGRVDLVYVNRSSQARHQVLSFSPANKTVLSASESDLNQSLNASPALTCSGYQQLELVGRGTDNRVWHNHMVGITSPQGVVEGRTVRAGWQGWSHMIDKFFGTVFLTSRVNPGIALASTRTGDVELLASARGSGARAVYENEWDSRRFGVSPWKAVHWRGLQELNSLRIVGSPALALSDRHTELAIAWAEVVPTPVATLKSLVWRSPLGDNNLPRFARLPQAEIKNGTDPVVISSGPGSIETFYLGPNGRVEDVRLLNGLPVPTELPALGLNISAFSVAAFGSGQIELVGVANDRTLHHWRRINGQWSDPTTISGTVISAPILAHIGDGQLDLLAVGGDQRVYHWRFLSGLWTDYYQAASDFDVSAVAFGSSAASTWGDGTVDVVVAEARSGRMHHGRTIPLELGMGWAEIGGSTFETPSLAALGPENLGVFALGTDGFLYENWSRVPQGGTWTNDDRRFGRHLQWPGFSPLTATKVFAGPVARSGDDELSVLVSDSNARVYLSRRQGRNWSGFAVLPGQPNDVRSAPLYRPAVEVH